MKRLPKNFIPEKLLLFVLLLLIYPLITLAEMIDCGLPQVKVKCENPQDCMAGCRGIKRALNFFEINGYKLNKPINVEFLNKVTVQDKQKLALYDGKKHCSEITSFSEDFCRNKKAFGALPMNLELYTSVVTHEVAHRLYHMVCDERCEKADYSFSELIAYITQIETMDEPDKTEVLNLYSVGGFSSVFAITSILWQLNPNKFGVISYRFFQTKPEIFKQILDGKAKSIESQFIFNYCDF